jgi:hypothetical protein
MDINKKHFPKVMQDNDEIFDACTSEAVYFLEGKNVISQDENGKWSNNI